VEARVLRDSDRVDTGGISTVGTPLRVAFRNNRPAEQATISSLDINGVNFVVTVDPTGTFSGITQDTWTPTQPGTYLLRTTAITPIGGSVPVSTTVRIVAAGGGIDTDNTQPPRVLGQRTYPRPNARNVQTSIFPTIAFSEPVVGVTLQTVRLTRADLTPGPVPPATTDEAFKISGVTASGQVIDDVSQAPTLPITAITIQPLFGLKYKQLYTLTLSDGIQDLDTVSGSPAPKSLVPYTTTFQTFGPESIPPDEGGAQSYTTTGFYVAKNQEGEPVSMWSLKHQIAGSSWFSLLTGYDISDPVNPSEMTTTQIFGRPMDVAGEGTTLVVGTAPGVRSIPSNVHLYDVSDPAAPKWMGSATLANSANQGTVQRVNLRGNRIYAGTLRRGIQIVDVDFLKNKLLPCCTVEYFRMLSDLNLDGQGYATEALITSVPVSGPGGQLASFTGIKSIPQGSDPLIVASGNFGLALAKESSPNAALKVWKPSKDGIILDYGTALDVASVGGYDLAVVAGVFGGRQYLMTVNVTDPALPVVQGVREVVTDLGIVDVLVTGSTVYVSTQRTTAPAAVAVEVFEISDPSNIAHLGRVDGVGGRLAIAGKLLYGATTSTFGSPIDGLGGVRTAALGTLALVDGTSPNVVVVGEGPRAAEDFKLKYRVFPPDTEVATAKIEYRQADATVGDPVNVALNADGRGELALPVGFTFPAVGENVARPRLSVTTAEGEEIVGPLKSWRHEQPSVELVFDDDQEDEDVTADKPEVEVRAVSAEWYRRYADARDKGEPLPSFKVVSFASVLPAGVVSPAEVSSRDGIFETSLASLTVPAAGHQVRAFIGPVTLGISNSAGVLPGPAQTIDLSASRPDLPLDGASETTITLTARDVRGNLVLDGTGVFWETDGDGEFVEPLEATSNGQATVKYRAGEGKAGPVTITARIDDVEETVTLQQHPLQVSVALDRTEAFLDTLAIGITATVTSQGGVVSPNAEVSVVSSSGKVTITEPLANGRVRARWEPASSLYRQALGFSVAVADARGSSPYIPWIARLAPLGQGADFGARDDEILHGPSANTLPAQGPGGGEVVPVASTFPAVIAGDKTQDGSFDLELPDGSTRALPYTAQSTYRVTGLVPGERVALSLGSNARPNMAPISYYSATQGIVNGQAPDDLARHDGDASQGVQAVADGFLGPAYAFNGTGTITIAHDPVFAFPGGFMVQAAIRPPPGSNGVIVEKAGQFRLDLVDGHPRFSVQTGAAIGAAGEASVTSAQPVLADQWTLLGAKFDGTTLKVIVGDYEESIVLSSSPMGSTAPVVIGPGFIGSIDEIRFFDLWEGPLLTFAGGATELQGVADASGNFETVIRSGGALVAGTHTPIGRFAFAGNPSRFFESEFLAQGEPTTATQDTLGRYVVDVNAIFEGSAQRATTPLGVAASDMLARAFLVIGGIWGAGPPDDPYVMAGDLVLGTIVQAISTPRDLWNAFDHARKGQADKFEVLTIAMAAAGAAALVFSKKAAILGKFRKLPKLLKAFGPAEEANRVLGKRLLKGIKEVVDDLPGGKTLENVAEAAETISTTGKQALGNVLGAVGDQGRMLDKVETLVKNAPDKEALVRALGEAEQTLPRNRFKVLLSVAGACAVGAAAESGPSASCPIHDAAAIAAWAEALDAGASAAYLGKIALRTANNLDAPKDVVVRLGKLYAANAQNTSRLVSDLAHPNNLKAFGAQAVLDLGVNFIERPAAQRATKLAFEEGQKIAALRTAKGNIRSRIYDLVVDGPFGTGGAFGRLRYEVKRWTSFPPSSRSLNAALDQFERDFVAHFTEQGLAIKELRWKFPSLPESHRVEVTKLFLARIENSEIAREALRGSNRGFGGALADLRAGAATLFEFR